MDDARFWYGHSTAAGVAHYHNPATGVSFIPSEETLLGYALDGFPLYGPVPDADAENLDNCNGRFVDGSYRYHVRTLEQVDEALTYCPITIEDPAQPYTNWNYILGCYHGDASETVIKILSDDELNENTFPTAASFPYTSCELVNEAETDGVDEDTEDTQPNVIIIQPDDLPFFDAWGPPPNNPSLSGQTVEFPGGNSLPNIERLRLNGIQLNQAYAASSACGTSRFSTLTGKYPSRAASSRSDTNRSLATVTIPKTKLIDVEGYGNDCTEENLAVAMKNGGYRTGVVGKWHLFPTDPGTYTYESVQEEIRKCGFDFAEAIYPEVSWDMPTVALGFLSKCPALS